MKLDTLTDSTGCGDGILDNSSNEGPIFHTRGITELELAGLAKRSSGLLRKTEL